MSTSTGLKYSDGTTILSMITGSITLASVAGFLSPTVGASVAGISALATAVLIPITRFLQSKGD